MKKMALFVLLVIFALSLQIPLALADEATASYSAVETISTPRGEMKARVFVVPGMQRMEMQRAIQILRFNRGVMWVLMPQQRMFMERPIEAAPEGSANLKYLERKKLGKDTVNGIPAAKYKTVAEDQQGNRLTGFSWLTDDGILVRNDMRTSGGGRTMKVKIELSNLKVGSQNPSLFEVPQGYKKFSMPAGMPGGFTGGMMRSVR